MKLIETFQEALAVTKITTGKECEKLAKVIMLARNRNACDQKHLFESGMIEGVDYLLCPFTGMRKAKMKEDHYKKIGFKSFSEVLAIFPDIKTVLPSIAKKKKATMNIVNSDGRTIQQLSEEKRVKTRNEVGDDGMTIDERAGKKAAHERMHGLDEYGVPKSVSGRSTTRNNQVIVLSQNQSTELVERYISFTNWLSTRVRSKVAVPGSIITTRVSVNNGFSSEVSPWVIAHECNYIRSGTKDLTDLYSESGITAEQSKIEFNHLMELWTKEILIGSPHNSENTFRYFKDHIDSLKMYYL